MADKLSEEEFFTFCSDNKDLRIERDEHGNILIMAPVASETGRYKADLVIMPGIWNKEKGDPGVVFGPFTGFTLPDGSIRSPDAAWIVRERWQALHTEERRRFALLAPDFVAEIRSPSDNLTDLKDKLDKWIGNGVQLAWPIDPEAQNAWIYRTNGEVELVEGPGGVLTGEGLLPGLEVPLATFSDQED